LSKKPKTTEDAFSPEQLAALENKGDRQVRAERQKEGIFQRYNARRDAKSMAKDVRWKRRSGIALIILVLVLFLIWMISWLYTSVGDLVISVDSTAAKKGISISANADGSDPKTQLSAPMAAEVTNITYNWLPATLDMEADGSHNGRNYLAYTFYLSNTGSETLDYDSQLEAVRAAKSADEAVRIMVYKNGVPAVYAKPNTFTDDSGKPIPFETIFEKVIPDNYTPPTPEEIAAKLDEVQNKTPVDVTDTELPITEFVEDNIVFHVKGEGLAPGQTDKYTIVVWIEGEDPECIDEIRGGYVKLHWLFEILEDEATEAAE
jgi:hypothetical protein